MESSVSGAHLYAIPWEPRTRTDTRKVRQLLRFPASALRTVHEIFSTEEPNSEKNARNVGQIIKLASTEEHAGAGRTARKFVDEVNKFKTQKLARKQRTKQRRPGMKGWESQTGKNVRKKQVDGFVSSVVEALECSENASQVLEEVGEELESREQSQILKEQRDWSRAVEVFNWFQKQKGYKPNGFLYNILFKTLGRHRKWELVEHYWKEMAREKVEPTNVTYSTLVDAFGGAGMKDEALFYYKHMKEKGVEPDEVMVSTFVNLQRRLGDLKTAEEAFWSLFSGDGEVRPRNPETYNTMITLYGEHERFADASKVFTEMMKADVQLTTVTFNTMIHMYGKIGLVKEAEQLLGKMAQKSCVPDVATYNCVVEMYVRNECLEQAFGCLERMHEAGISPDQVTYRTLICAYATAGMAWKAETLVQRMENSGFYIDHRIYMVMISMYIRARNVSKAESVLSYMRSRGGALEASSYVAVMDAYTKQGFLQQTRDIMELSKKDGIKSSAVYNVMIKAYGLAGKHSEAVAVYESMESEGVSADEVTYNTVIQLSCKAQLLELLQKVLPLMKAAGFKPNLAAVSSVISFYANIGRVREAENMFEELTVEPDAICYSALLNAYAEAGFAEEAQQTLNAMKEAGFVQDTVVYTTMMKLFSNLGMLEEAERIYSDITRLKPDLFAANTMLSLYIKSGMFKQAEQLFRALEHDAPGMNQVTCTMMLKLYRNTGMIEQGLYVAKLMEDRFLLKDVTAFNELIAMYAKAGLMREAFMGIKEMKDVGMEPNRNTYSCFEEALENAGMPKESIKKLEGGSSRIETMGVLAPLYAQAGMISEAVEIAFGIQRASKEEGEEELDVNAYNAMIYTFGKAGKLDLALKMYTEMQGKGVELNEATYNSVIAAYGKAGLLEGVGRMFRRLKDHGYQPSFATYKTVIEMYKEAGRMDLASLVSQELHFAQYVRGGMVASEEEEPMVQVDENDLV